MSLVILDLNEVDKFTQLKKIFEEFSEVWDSYLDDESTARILSELNDMIQAADGMKRMYSEDDRKKADKAHIKKLESREKAGGFKIEGYVEFKETYK